MARPSRPASSIELHINDQKPLRYDQDLSFGSVSIKEAFLLVKLTVDHKFQGAKSWDAHPYRSEDEKGTWEFVARNMRTWKILEEKVHQVAADKEIAALLTEIQETDPAPGRLSAPLLRREREEDQGPPPQGGQHLPAAAACRTNAWTCCWTRC